MCECVNSQGVSKDQLVCVVKQGHLRPFYQQEESELDKQHQDQLPYAADVQEHRAGQQGEQYAIAEILGRPERKSTKVKGLYKQKKKNTRAAPTQKINMTELTSGKWQGIVWLEHRVKLSSFIMVRLCSRHRVTEDTFSSSATQSCSFSLLQVNWQEGRRQHHHL